MKKFIKNNKKIDILVMIIILFIIIILFLHNCVLQSKNDKEKNEGDIDICDNDNCNPKPGPGELLINCLEDYDNSLCTIPDFRGKTEDDVNSWLNKLSNNIDITYQVYNSIEKDGFVIDQSNEKTLTVKDLLDKNIPLVITFANSKSTKVDCLKDVNNDICKVPDFSGKTKKDVYEWLNKISNELMINFDDVTSTKTNGTIIEQSIKNGTTVKSVLDKNQELNITFSNEDKVDCLVNDNDPVCVVPNFTGETQKEVEEWLDSISNIITTNYESVDSEAKSKTIVRQSIKPGTTVKQLLKNRSSILIGFAEQEKEELIDCLKDVNNQACLLPSFVGKTKEDIDKWLDSISNVVKIKYQTVESDKNTGIITGQSFQKGINVKELLDNNSILVITVSKKKTTPMVDDNSNQEDTNNNENEPENINNDNNTEENNTNENVEPDEPEDVIPEDELDKVVVKDSNVKWETDSILNIFNNSIAANNKIAPEASNTYRFTINNNTKFDVKYNISFVETNTYNINMKYKLRKNNTYVIDEYVSINDIVIDEQLLESGHNDAFYLEWKWISSENDTEIGTNPSSNYTLKIEVEAEGINE